MYVFMLICVYIHIYVYRCLPMRVLFVMSAKGEPPCLPMRVLSVMFAQGPQASHMIAARNQTCVAEAVQGENHLGRRNVDRTKRMVRTRFFTSIFLYSLLWAPTDGPSQLRLFGRRRVPDSGAAVHAGLLQAGHFQGVHPPRRML